MKPEFDWDDDLVDERDSDDGYCDCGTCHTIEEMDSGCCDCCGLSIACWEYS